MRTLIIHRWTETFESADTRKRERLKSFHAPSGTDSRGYLALVSRFPQDRAMMAFGVFQALCQLSATLGRSVRGAFKNTDGTAMELQQISALLRLQECHLSAAIEILADQRVAWLRWEGSADNLPPSCHFPPGFVQGEGEGEGEEPPKSPKGDGQKTAGTEASRKAEERDRCLPEKWRNIPRSDRKRITVLRNTPLMERIGHWFNRRPGTLWTVSEGVALFEIKPALEDVDTLEAYYLAVIHRDDDHRRKNLETLLNNWRGEIDRANGWSAENR